MAETPIIDPYKSPVYVPDLRVAELLLKPFKSLGAMRVEEVEVAAHGLKNNRVMCLVTKNPKRKDRWEVVTARKSGLPHMATIGQRIEDDVLYVSHGGWNDVAIPLDYEYDDSRVITAHMDSRGGEVQGQLAEPRVSNEIAKALSANVKVLRFRPDLDNPLQGFPEDEDNLDQVSLTDTSPINILSLASLRWLNVVAHRTRENAYGPERFGAEIVIDGEGLSPWDEDHFEAMAAGRTDDVEDLFASVFETEEETKERELHMVGLGASVRCEMPDIHPVSGRVGNQILEILKKYRKGHDLRRPNKPGVLFGINANARKKSIGVKVKQGDPFRVPVWHPDSFVVIKR